MDKEAAAREKVDQQGKIKHHTKNQKNPKL